MTHCRAAREKGRVKFFNWGTKAKKEREPLERTQIIMKNAAQKVHKKSLPKEPKVELYLY